VVSNAYYEPKTRRVALPGRGDGKRPPTHVIADGHFPNLLEKECRRSGPANFVHSMDATHLAKTVLSADAENIEMLTVHDCFACTAPNARRMREIINAELAALYTNTNPLADLVWKNLKRIYAQVEHRAPGGKHEPSWFYAADAGKKFKRVVWFPPFGTLDPTWVRWSQYAFS
jgi:DNA-directed RNA polymerase